MELEETDQVLFGYQNEHVYRTNLFSKVLSKIKGLVVYCLIHILCKFYYSSYFIVLRHQISSRRESSIVLVAFQVEQFHKTSIDGIYRITK